jgi:hypothetical protein
MIKVEIQAEDYRVTEALADTERLIDNGSLDVIYDGLADEINCVGEYYSASFKYVGEEKPANQKNEEQVDALQKLCDMPCEEFTEFMRSIELFGDNDYVCFYDCDEIANIVDKANNEGYSINIKIETHDEYIHVKYIDTQYCKTCVVNGLSFEDDVWEDYFKLSKIAEDYTQEIINFNHQ